MVSVGAVAILGAIVTALPILVPFDRYVAAYMSSPEMLREALWTVSGSPIVVAARDVLDGHVTLDIAAMRYGDGRLVVASVAAGALGLVLLVFAGLRVMREETGDGPR
ncbi:MAG TPA: hypothetical protein DEG70_06070 [Chloroflexi bacterium]|nr:hypothetical protein [Chloroflexota bacterium]